MRPTTMINSKHKFDIWIRKGNLCRWHCGVCFLWIHPVFILNRILYYEHYYSGVVCVSDLSDASIAAINFNRINFYLYLYKCSVGLYTCTWCRSKHFNQFKIIIIFIIVKFIRIVNSIRLPRAMRTCKSATDSRVSLPQNRMIPKKH